MDEVPTQALNLCVPLSIASDSDLTANLSRRFARRGWRHAVRRKPLSAPVMVRRGKPLQPTRPAMGFAPPGHRGNASLAASWNLRQTL